MPPAGIRGGNGSTTDLAGGRRVIPTIHDVAAVAGVSRATASRVINGSHRVSSESRSAVEAAVATLGFRPNLAARSLATGRTGSVALVVAEPDVRMLTDAFFGEVVVGLSASLAESDIQLVLVIARRDERAGRTSRYLSGGHVDGAVVVFHRRDHHLHKALVESGLPTIFVGRPLGVTGAHYIDTDNELGARLATAHLIARGRRRIATIAGPADMAPGVDRLAGWRAAMAEHDLPTDAVAFGDFTRQSGVQAMEDLLSLHSDLDAVFVASDLMASGAIAALASAGRRVPADVSVIGFDDLGLATATDPPLSTVAHPAAEMATRAGQMIQSLISGEVPDAGPVVYSPRLVPRSSV